MGLPVHGHQAGGPADIGLQLILDVLVGDVHLGLGGGEALVGLQGDLGADGDQGGEDEALLLVDLHDVHDGVAHVLQVLLLHGLLIGGGIDVVDGLLIEHGGAVHALDDLAGGLALPEAGDGDVLAGLQICLLNRGLKRIRLYLDGQLHGAVFFFLYVGDLHEFFLLWARSGVPQALSRRAVYFRDDILPDTGRFDQPKFRFFPGIFR